MSATPFPVVNRAALPADSFAALAGRVSRHTSIKRTLDWFLGMVPPVPPVDCVAQDEFSHDVLFPHPDGYWLSYGCS